MNASLKIKNFLIFLRLDKLRFFNFITTLVIFAVLPYGEYKYPLDYQVQAGPIREVEYDLGEVSLYPTNVTGRQAPYLSAFSAFLIDLDSKTIIFQKNPDYQLFPASTTKIMTALVSLEEYDLNEVVEIKEVNSIGQKMGLEDGEKITVNNLLYGLLVQSGNDSAQVLADYYPGGEKEFVKRMNQKAKEFNLLKTNFTNPAGIDELGHLSTTHDLAILAVEAIKEPKFLEIVGTKEIKVSDVEGEITHELENVNKLLGEVKGLKGIKTGWTASAGECLVSLTERDEREIITVVLGSQDRFGETKALIEWVFGNFKWE